MTREVGGIPHRAGQGRRRHRVHELLAATRPAVAIISAGLDNDYGHPHRSTLDILTHDKKDALILDFFAGSGTTLHATMLLNAQDEGRRRCVLVTNNELRAESATRLNKEGHFRGDVEFEAAGVFESACRPRVTAAVTGKLSDGTPVDGKYLDGREYAEGFPENVEFFRLDYLDGADVEFGLRFAELHALLWMRAGGIGERQEMDPSKPLAIAAAAPYA